MPTFALIPEQASIKPLPLAIGQFRQCGFWYTTRKYLTISLLHQYASHLTVLRALLLPNTRYLIKHHPKAAFKYLHKYLARSFDISTRALILSYHYHYLSRYVVHDFIESICCGSIPLWLENIDGNRYGIGLTYPKNEEGELLMVFSENAIPLFTLSFTIAPGEQFELPGQQVIFIGRLQGARAAKTAIRRATHACHNLTPATLLLAATRTLADSLDISGIVGVSAQNQVCLNSTSLPDSAPLAYDEFWIAAGARRISPMMYYLDVAIHEKPLSAIKSNHRSRVKRKRQFKHALAESVFHSFRHICVAQLPTRS